MEDFPQYFDEDVAPDIAAILHTAALLDITEYLVFKLAYKDWFGERATDERVEPHFVKYMFQEIVPIWVRQYTRKVIKLDEEGSLNPRSLGVYKRLPSRRMILVGKTYMGFLLAVFFALTYVAYKDSDWFRGWLPISARSEYHYDHRAMP